MFLRLLFRRRLLGDDFVFDLVVSGLRQNLLTDELVLPRIRPTVDDLLRVGRADSWRLSCAECDEASEQIVGRNAHSHTISRHDLDVEPAHSSA